MYMWMEEMIYLNDGSKKTHWLNNLLNIQKNRTKRMKSNLDWTICRIQNKKVENYVNIIGTAITKFTFTVSYFEELHAMKNLQTKYHVK
jgi:hypothetical protein